jgi:hypothetical protein
MHFSAAYGTGCTKPAVLEISQSLTRGRPESATIILKKRLHQIIGQTICLMEDRRLAVLQPGQTFMSAYPNAPVSGGKYGLRSIAGQALLHRNSSDRELAEPVESAGGGDPNISFTILEKTEYHVPGKAIGLCKYICLPVMYMNQTALDSSDPKASIAVSKHTIRVDVAVLQKYLRIERATHRLRFEFVADELQEPCTVDGN